MDYETFEDAFSYTSLGAIHFKHHPGNGEKIIFLHGIGGTTRAWKRLMTYMPDDLDIYLVDLLGHGESDAPEIDYMVSVQFQAFREFVSLQNNGDSYIFGHSYGAWVAAYYATQPYTCKGLILEDSAGLNEQFEDLLASGKANKERENILKDSLEHNNKEYVIRSMLYTNDEEDRLTSQMLSNIRRRTLLIWGADDQTVPIKYAMLFHSMIKGSELKIIQGAGHFPHYEQPEATRDAVLQFIGYKAKG